MKVSSPRLPAPKSRGLRSRRDPGLRIGRTWGRTGIPRLAALAAGMPDLYSLVHREAGPLATFTTREEADLELLSVLDDEPGWVGDLAIETFELDVTGASSD